MHLAQLNIARLTHPLEHPASAEFVAGLDPINELAEASPGFVWRLQGDGADATDLRPHDDPEVIVNMSVWETPRALNDFAFRSAHAGFLRRRVQWFTPMAGPSVVAWWVAEGHEPTVDEAFARLAFFTEHGASPYAFTVTRPAQALSITRTHLDDPVALELIDELNATLDEMYPEPGANHFRLDVDEVVGDNGLFLVARLDGEPVGCGAFRRDSDDTAEIKRMFVRPSARGLKVGAAVLAELETRAAALGVATMRLETGARQAAATKRYERAGYSSCPCWGEYADAPLSVCMSKALVAV